MWCPPDVYCRRDARGCDIGPSFARGCAAPGRGGGVGGSEYQPNVAEMTPPTRPQLWILGREEPGPRADGPLRAPEGAPGGVLGAGQPPAAPGALRQGRQVELVRRRRQPMGGGRGKDGDTRGGVSGGGRGGGAAPFLIRDVFP